MEFLFLPTDIIRQENQFEHAEGFHVMRCPKFLNSFNLFVSFKYIDCSVSTFYAEKTTLPFANNGHLGNTVAHKTPKGNKSDFQFTYSLERNRIFSFVGKKKLQWFMYFLGSAVQPEMHMPEQPVCSQI